MVITYFLPQFTFKLEKRVESGLKQGHSRIQRSSIQQLCTEGCMKWTELMFLLGGQTKVSWILVATAITKKHLESTSLTPTYSIAESCCRKRENRATTSNVRIPVGQGKYVPFP